MRFKTTKLQCQKGIDKYDVVCRGCGGKITPIKTVDNSGDPTYWSGCLKCGMFENGVSLKVHQIAKLMVIGRRFRAYSHSEEPEDLKSPEHEYWLTTQIKGTCNIVQDILKYNRELESE